MPLTSFALETPLFETVPVPNKLVNPLPRVVYAMMDAKAVEKGFDVPHYSQKEPVYNILMDRTFFKRIYKKEGKTLNVTLTCWMLEGSLNN